MRGAGDAKREARAKRPIGPVLVRAKPTAASWIGCGLFCVDYDYESGVELVRAVSEYTVKLAVSPTRARSSRVTGASTIWVPPDAPRSSVLLCAKNRPSRRQFVARRRDSYHPTGMMSRRLHSHEILFCGPRSVLRVCNVDAHNGSHRWPGPGGRMDTDRRAKRRWKPGHWQTVAIVLVVVGVVVAAGVYGSIRGYESSVTKQLTQHDLDRQIPNGFANSPETDFAILASVQSVSPDSHTALVRLSFGDALGQRKYDYFDSDDNLKVPLTVSIHGGVTDAGGPSLSNGSSDSSNSYLLAKGTHPTIDVTMDLPGSDAPKYPFDSYAGALSANVTQTDGRRVPSFVAGFIAADGWTLSQGSQNQFPDGNSYGLVLDIKRASDSQLYALFIMALMWALAIAGIVVAVILIRSNTHEIGADHLVYLAALLFALPLMRTLLPGNPSLGVLADFAAYFWVEVVVGLTLLALLIVWISRNRPPRGHDKDEEQEQKDAEQEQEEPTADSSAPAVISSH